MIPGAIKLETHVARIEIRNEVKTTKTKNIANTLPCVKFSELSRAKNTKEFADSNTGIVKILDGGVTVTNLQAYRKLIAVNNVYRMDMDDTYTKKKPSKRKKSGGDIRKSNKDREEKPEKIVGEDETSRRDDGRMEYIPGRNAFVAKVFSITFLMIIITIALVATAVSSKNLKRYFTDPLYGALLFFTGVCGMLCLNLKVMCSPCMRMFPSNILILVIAVSCMSLVASCIAAANETRMVIYAMLATATTVFICYLLAFTRLDFTKFLVHIFGIGITFIVVSSIVLAIMVETGIRNKPIEVLLLYLGTICITTILIMKLQLILGGKTTALAEKDYALGAFMLYTSIVDLFLRLLQMCGLVFIEDEDLLDDIL